MKKIDTMPQEIRRPVGSFISTRLVLAGLLAVAAASGEAQSLLEIPSDPAKVRAAISVKDDPLEPRVFVSSVSVLVDEVGRDGIEGDAFLFASIDRKTKEAKAYLYGSLKYQDAAVKRFNRVTYESPDGIVEATLVSGKTDVSRCSLRAGAICDFREHFGVEVPARVLFAVSRSSDPTTPWRFKFASPDSSFVYSLPTIEIATFVAVVGELSPSFSPAEQVPRKKGEGGRTGWAKAGQGVR